LLYKDDTFFLKYAALKILCH